MFGEHAEGHKLSIPTRGQLARTITDLDINMSFEPNQFRRLIKSTLLPVDSRLCSVAAVELLMLTAAAESQLGRYLYQVNGPALGVFQIEPDTAYDIRDRLFHEFGLPGFHTAQLVYSLRISIIVARLKYWDFPEPLPHERQIKKLAEYYKRYYNTSAGKATPDKALEAYWRFCY